MDAKYSLYGRGFIGGRYDELYPAAQVIHRDVIGCIHPKILNFRSTIHNYHPIDNQPLLDIQTNLLNFMQIVARARLTFQTRAEITHVSSWFVYGNTECPAKETSVCDPHGFYSITKRTSEQLLISYCETFGMHYRILRLANVLGVGDCKASKRKNALQYLIREIVWGHPVSIYKDDVQRDYIWVDDVCHGIHIAMTDGDLNTIYNIGNGVPQSLHALLEYVMDKVGYDRSKVTWVETPDFHKVVQVRNMWLDTTKITELGYKPTKTIYEIIDLLIGHYERNRSQ